MAGNRDEGAAGGGDDDEDDYDDAKAAKAKQRQEQQKQLKAKTGKTTKRGKTNNNSTHPNKSPNFFLFAEGGYPIKVIHCNENCVREVLGGFHPFET